VATQRRFTADASHELRAPLTTIQGNLGLLLNRGDDLPPSEQREMLTDAHAESLRLGLLVNDLLALARADVADDVVPTPEAAGAAAPTPGQRPARLVDLDRIVLDLVRQFRGRLAAEPGTPRLEIAHIEPVRIRGDEEGLRRLALILLDNAIKYTPAGKKIGARGREAVVSVSLRRHDGQALLRVCDTGIGIEPADLPHLFEPFFRADRARDRQGTGLGLSIARSLADQHGGTIAVESTPGRGSTFTVRLPAPPLL
jgi:signal transduction histidine kinase